MGKFVCMFLEGNTSHLVKELVAGGSGPAEIGKSLESQKLDLHSHHSQPTRETSRDPLSQTSTDQGDFYVIKKSNGYNYEYGVTRSKNNNATLRAVN